MPVARTHDLKPSGSLGTMATDLTGGLSRIRGLGKILISQMVAGCKGMLGSLGSLSAPLTCAREKAGVWGLWSKAVLGGALLCVVIVQTPQTPQHPYFTHKPLLTNVFIIPKVCQSYSLSYLNILPNLQS